MTIITKSFFKNSELLDHEVTRPLSHIRPNWELTWDHEADKFSEAEGSFAGLLNSLIAELGQATPPSSYHDNEDRLAQYAQARLGWKIRKVGSRWIGDDYSAIIEQGGFDDVNDSDLALAAAGRIQAAIIRGQAHYDNMEESHRRMVGAVLAIILYHREAYDTGNQTA